jgi:hypothetical protein
LRAHSPAFGPSAGDILDGQIRNTTILWQRLAGREIGKLKTCRRTFPVALPFGSCQEALE